MATDRAKRENLLRASYGQPQITNPSYLLVFAAKKNFSETDVDAFVNRTAATLGSALSVKGIEIRDQVGNDCG